MCSVARVGKSALSGDCVINGTAGLEWYSPGLRDRFYSEQ